MNLVLAYIHRNALSVLLEETSTSLTRTHVECFAQSEERRQTGLHLQRREQNHRASKPCPFWKEWKFPWREDMGNNVIGFSKYWTIDCSIRKVMQFIPSLMFTVPASRSGSHGGTDLKTKSGLPEVRGQTWSGFLLTNLRRNQPCWRLDLGLLASRTVRQ